VQGDASTAQDRTARSSAALKMTGGCARQLEKQLFRGGENEIRVANPCERFQSWIRGELGMLRLRVCFASQSKFLAQHDRDNR
jgi:hypothetical protein